MGRGEDPEDEFLFSPSIRLLHTMGGSVWLIQTPSSWLAGFLKNLYPVYNALYVCFSFLPASYSFFSLSFAALGLYLPMMQLVWALISISLQDTRLLLLQ